MGGPNDSSSLKCSCLYVVLFLFVAGEAAQARQIPTRPAELSAADRREILDVLGLDAQEVRSIDGFRFVRGPGTEAVSRAMVRVAGERLADRVETGREILCYRWQSSWACNEENALEVLYVRLPEQCPAEVAPRIGGRLAPAGRSVPMVRDQGPSVREALAIVEWVCTSEVFAQEARAIGHRVQAARRNVDGELELSTEAPDNEEAGLVFLLEERCENGACRLVLGKKHGWMT